jgi:hypothetical protein
MKKTILATIAFAVATMPLTFAAQTPANPPASGSQTTKKSSDTTAKKKHSSKKSTKKSGSTASPTGGK